MAAQQQQRQWSSPDSLEELMALAARLSQPSQTSLEADLRSLAAKADQPRQADPEEDRERAGAELCLQNLLDGKGLETFDAAFLPGTPMSIQQWVQKNEYVHMQVKMKLNDLKDMLADQHQAASQAASEASEAALEVAKQAARAASFSERRLERAWLPAPDYFRHMEQSAGWLDRRTLRLQLAQVAFQQGCCCPCWLAAWRAELHCTELQVEEERRQAAQQPAGAAQAAQAQPAAQPAQAPPLPALHAPAPQAAQPPAQQGMAHGGCLAGLLQPLLN